MKLALAAVVSFLTLFPQDPSVFTEQYVGLQFTHPATWKVVKTTKDRTYLSIPVTGTSETAELQIIRDGFHADKELFQTVQLRINEQLKREVVRQWEQEILGVPMMFTKVNFSEGGIAKSTLIGLFNTRTPLKMHLRLTTRQADYDNVAYELQQALETLRTVDGKLPQADDPSIKLGPAPAKPTPVPTPPKVIDSEKKPINTVKPTQSAELTVSLRKINLRYPEGWTVTEVRGNSVTLKSPEMKEPITIELFLTLDSDPPQRALFKASSKSLGGFTQVTSREDKASAANKAGATITSVWRQGKSEGGELATYEAVGLAGDFYFLLGYRQKDMAEYRSDRKVIESLVDLLTIEPVQ